MIVIELDIIPLLEGHARTEKLKNPPFLQPLLRPVLNDLRTDLCVSCWNSRQRFTSVRVELSSGFGIPAGVRRTDLKSRRVAGGSPMLRTTFAIPYLT